MEHKRAPLTVLEATLDEGLFAGHASIFGVPDDGLPPDVIERGAFSKTIAEWGPLGKNRIKVLALHRHDWLPIGRPLELREDERGLYVRAKISDTSIGRDVLTLLRDGVLTELSIGFDAVKAEPPTPSRPYRVLREVRLWELSPVTWALHPQATIEAVKSLRTIGGPVLAEHKTVPRNVSEALAPRETAWEAPTLRDFTDQAWDELDDAARRRIAGHYAWSATWPPERFSDLKLPHHRPSDGRVVWRGVVAAMAALLGARGGVALPAAERRAVYAHLAAHYRAFGAEPPDLHSTEADLDTVSVSPVRAEPAVRLEPDPELLQSWRCMVEEMRATVAHLRTNT